MESKFILDLTIKYGLNSVQATKLTDVLRQCGVTDFKKKKARVISSYICEMGMVEHPMEEIIEEMKRKGWA